MIRFKDIFTFTERRIVFLIVLAVFLCFAVRFAAVEQFRKIGFNIEVDYETKALIDIRVASLEELQTVRHIGPVIAQRIIDYRQEKGFHCIDDLKNVRGIGEKTLASIKPFLVDFGDSTAVNIDAGKEEKLNKENKIDINRATKEELMRLRGIGEVKAGRILKLREEKGRFSQVEELLEVKGIGPKTLAAIKPYIKCGR